MDGARGVVHGSDGEMGAGKAAGFGLAASKRGKAGTGNGGGSSGSRHRSGMEIFEEKEGSFGPAGKAEGGMFTGAEKGGDGVPWYGGRP